MINIFRDTRTGKRTHALRSGDIDTLYKLTPRTTRDMLSEHTYDGYDAIEYSIRCEQPQSLEWVLKIHPAANGYCHTGEPYCLLALRQPSTSLALLSALLHAGANANTVYQQRSLLQWCFELCNSTELMLHINRLAQYGASLQDKGDLIRLALDHGDQALIHFLVHSGATVPAELVGDDSLVNYARHCLEDKRIREAMMAR